MKGNGMSNANPWTTKEKQLMREKYPDLGPRGMAQLVNHSPMSCRTMAQLLGITLSREAMAKVCSDRAKAAHGKKPPEKPRQPFDDVPREYIKVQSIFRVGQRYSRSAA